MEELTVSELCIPGLDEWDVELINDLFNPRDAAEIKSLQPRAMSNDVRIWGLSRDGDYTVRSAYRLIMERIADRSNLHVAGDWLNLWNIAAPPRMKVLLWRIARGVLPTRMALQARTLQVPDTCAAVLKEEIERVVENSDGMADWIFKAIQSLPEEKCQAAAAILNEIWRERNNRVWSNQRQPARITVCMALDSIHEWRKAQEVSSTQQTNSTGDYCQIWHPQEANMIKCNVDATLFREESKWGSGMITRRADGTIVAFRMNAASGCPPARTCEALAMLEAVKWLNEGNYRRVIIETDSVEVERAINQKKTLSST
ncbi:hypothetical protein LINPERHAP2_LOCUS33910 [Linum perenne]